jgi:hypothetical protein
VRVPSVAEICNVCGAVPLPGITESQEESLLAVNGRLPPPVFVILTVDAAGLVPLPCVPMNERVDWEIVRTGLEVIALP